MTLASDELPVLLALVARGERSAARARLNLRASLATQSLRRDDEFFDARSGLQAYEGHTALHAAAFAYDLEVSRARCVPSARTSAHATVGARNRFTPPRWGHQALPTGIHRRSGR